MHADTWRCIFVKGPGYESPQKASVGGETRWFPRQKHGGSPSPRGLPASAGQRHRHLPTTTWSAQRHPPPAPARCKWSPSDHLSLVGQAVSWSQQREGNPGTVSPPQAHFCGLSAVPFPGKRAMLSAGCRVQSSAVHPGHRQTCRPPSRSMTFVRDPLTECKSDHLQAAAAASITEAIFLWISHFICSRPSSV